MARLDPVEGFKDLKDRVVGTIDSMFPIVGRERTIKLNAIEVKDTIPIDDLRSQKKAKQTGRTWSVPVTASVSLIDNATGKEVEKKDLRLLNLPKVTPRYSYIVDGQEYQMNNQWQLKPGVYNIVKQDGKLEAKFNLPRSFGVKFDPESRKFMMSVGTSNIPLHPILSTLGVGDDELKKSWGADILAANQRAAKDPNKAILNLHKAFTREKTTDLEKARETVFNVLSGTSLIPDDGKDWRDVTAATLGKGFNELNGDVLNRAASKLLSISRGDSTPDNRDSLIYKRLHSTEDFVADRLARKEREIQRKIKNNLDRRGKGIRDIIGTDLFNRPVKHLFTQTTLKERPDQANPLEMVSGQMKTTITGEGGITSEHAITDPAKLIDPSHLGFLDPIQTPEGTKTGVTLHLPFIIKKKGYQITTPVHNMKTGKQEFIGVQKAFDSNVVMPDQVTWNKGRPVARNKTVKISGPGNDIFEGPLSKADYVLPSSAGLFSVASNMIPFMQNDHGNRATMAGRQMEQSISLINREVPKVQVGVGVGNRTFEDVLGVFAGHSAHMNGTVHAIKSDEIQIKDDKGKIHSHQFYKDFPLNADGNFLDSKPIVSVGDTVKRGQPIADSNFTQNGTLALGTNLRVGYMPYKGLNFEDGVVISESAAKKLTSQHLHRESLDAEETDVVSKNKFRIYHPDRLPEEKASKLGDDGVIKPGMAVNPGDVLVAALRKKSPSSVTRMYSKMHRSLVKPFDDISVTWDKETPGIVTEVSKSGSNVTVYVKTNEQMQIGDKLCYAEDHELLTSTGWKSVKEIKLSDEICSLDPQTHSVEYLNPEEIHSYYCEDEDLYTLETTQVSMAVTMDHKVYARKRGKEDYDLIPVRELQGKRFRLKQDADWFGDDTVTSFEFPPLIVKAGQGGKGIRQIPSRTMSINNFLMLLGMFLSEGNYFGGASYKYGIDITQIKPDSRKEAEAALKSAGIKFTDAGDKMRLYSKQLGFYFEQFGKSHQKFIPNWVFKLPREQLKILYKWLMWGDGCVKGTTHVYTTTSKQLADDVQRLLLHIGYVGRISETPASEGFIQGRGPYKFRKRYDVRIIRSKMRPTINHGHSKSQQGQLEKIQKYTGNVFCVSLPRNHILYTRRNGKCHWSGNTARHANKGIVTAVLPDSEMPATKDGKPLQVLLNSTGVPGRVNVGQVLETAAGKIADKTGKPYIVHNFDGTPDYLEKVENELKALGISDKEEIIDPQSKKVLGKALVGPQYMFKLKHQVEKKSSARAGGVGYAYDQNMIPKSGGPHGAQSLGALGVYAMLAHGATSNLREFQTLKSDAGQQDELWSAIQAGEMLPAPRPTYAYNKFLSYIKGLGVDVKKQGDSLNLIPFTDEQVKSMSSGKIKDPGKMVQAKNMKEEKGGLFDPLATGGLDGTRWSHLELHKPYPNPLFEGAIRSLTDITKPQFESIITGAAGVSKDGKIIDPIVGDTGPDGIVNLLKQVDVDKDLARHKSALPSLKGTRLDKTNKKVKYLQALKNSGHTPESAYTMKNVPVVPPAMRPIGLLPNGDINTDDLNHMYKGIGLMDRTIKTVAPLVPSSEVPVMEAELYDGLRSLTGIGGFTNRSRRGILDVIEGKKPDPSTGEKAGQPKHGYFQDRLVKRRQDLSARSTIIPEPSLGLDEVGLPRKTAMEIYKPFVIREMSSLGGMTPLQAQKAIKENDPLASRALDRVVENRPVLMKRDPALHKYSIQAFKPRLTTGRAIQIHPLVTSGFNADFDGDAMAAFVPISNEAVEEARTMFPSRNLFSPATGKVMYAPTLESQLGISLLTSPGKKTKLSFEDMKEALKAMKEGEMGPTDIIRVGGKETTIGRASISKLLSPVVARKTGLEKVAATFGPSLGKKEQAELLSFVAKEDPNGFGTFVNKLKDMGNNFVTNTAFSLGLEDLRSEKKIRDPILRKADVKVQALMKGRPASKERLERLVSIYEDAASEVADAVTKEREKHPNNLYLMHKAGIKPGWDQLKQLTIAPMLVQNGMGEIIPTPIKKSYSEGLDVADYWTAQSGARRGILMKAQGTQEPGYATKQVMNSTMSTLITDKDCGADAGVFLETGRKDILDRYLAKPVRLGNKKETLVAGTLISPEVRDRLRNNKVSSVVVRSPLRCQHPDGICQKCFGLDENGRTPEIGKNIGVISAHALGERLTQLSLKAFHTGGVTSQGSSALSGFDRVNQLIKFPKSIPGSAPLASVGGKVDGIEKDPAGGFGVTIAGKRHYVPQDRGTPTTQFGGRRIGLKPGMVVQKGAALSAGPINPHDLLSKTSLNQVQNYLTNELDDIYRSEGIDRRNIEVLVKSLTNLTKIRDPGDHDNFLPGDFAPASVVKHLNKTDLRGKKPIAHTPILKGVNVLPFDMTTDWIARLNHERLRGTVIEAAQQGWSSDIHGTHPIPALVYGAEFGKPSKGRPKFSY